MIYVVFFSNAGTPETGLTPAIRSIRRLRTELT